MINKIKNQNVHPPKIFFKNLGGQENKSNLPVASGPVKEVWLWLLAIIIGAGILVIIASYLSV